MTTRKSSPRRKPKLELAVLRPTRGLEYAESTESVDEALRPYSYQIKRTWDKSIPDSFNWLVVWALTKTSAPVFLFIEEDIILPRNAIALMLELDTDIAAINYRLKVDERISQLEKFGKLLWVSLGCTLIRRKVFETLREPWFSTDYALFSKSPGSATQEKILTMEYNPRQYAGHDAYLCWNAVQKGFTIGAVKGVLCDHLKLDAMGQANTNSGCHKISRV